MVTHRGWQVDLTGYVQADSIAWSEDSSDELDPGTGEPLNQERFLIRRGRLRAETRRDALSGSIEFDGNTVNGAVARILSAQVGYTVGERGKPLVVLSAGLFKIPFGAGAGPTSATSRSSSRLRSRVRCFPATTMVVRWRAAATASAQWSVALMNGAPSAMHNGRERTSARAMTSSVGSARSSMPVSVADRGRRLGDHRAGLHAGTAATKDELQWVDENQDGIVQTTELQIVPGMTATPSQGFERNALGADIAVHWCLCKVGVGTAFAELVAATNLDRGIVYADPIVTDRDLRQLGFAIGIVQSIGEHAQLGVRYDRYDADRDANEREGVVLVGVDKVFSTVSVMATARWNDARVLVQYDHERNPFGRDDAGTPTTRSADKVTVRAQVGF